MPIPKSDPPKNRGYNLRLKRQYLKNNDTFPSRQASIRAYKIKEGLMIDPDRAKPFIGHKIRSTDSSLMDDRRPHKDTLEELARKKLRNGGRKRK